MLTPEESLVYAKALFETTQGSSVTEVIQENGQVFVVEYQTKQFKTPASSTQLAVQVQQLDAQKAYLISLQNHIMDEEAKVESAPVEEVVAPVEPEEVPAEAPAEEAPVEGEVV